MGSKNPTCSEKIHLIGILWITERLIKTKTFKVEVCGRSPNGECGNQLNIGSKCEEYVYRVL